MKLYRLWGIALRYLFLFRHSLDRLSDAFFWPVVDLVLWGLTSRYFASTSLADNHLVLAFLGGIILWIFPWRGQYEISVNLLEDLWNRNLVNLFVSPILFLEWITTLLLLGVVKALVSFAFAGCLALLLYQANIFSLGWLLLPWGALLILFGWVFGLLIAGIVMRYGTRIQTLAWTAIYIVAPFACVYYPVSILPPWAQTISRFVPASYVFEAMRTTLAGGTVPLTNLIWPLILCLTYFLLAAYMIHRSFLHILKRGLISVE
ncbi:MAG: ABC-2 type transporter [Microgenomates group bacterium GW2011_GWC1_46_16]|uniref:ABC transmembrane type-2 domain-containing protein n=2 Tax=Candidatus Collieribacteriota TaxID=1752725 RepID=A0A1F5FXC0_9BACT|nr:MAG: ABC-2 type transporter [Microgenomates group bacterium GW2011_GWF1_46_12]KKU26857.1 MAG: ABC-2 type transporter [Microgenomates group bacterium GW2011_GWC1_46_16]KKU28273.1 MAG: ABC-2 type transporter [Microgenomates group bacterium GW2011_GWF2_46_18]KKU45496.1 MAG: ABC-2 type transporter [Microgenomates group bacterium GW2011_GWB1_46_7]KKU62090.1 MAG: ABC-2 type transporter [Microgenomates group bacterium GW2011_GWE1_47_12]KKU62697.1 MAG: ABC-2 type transporter [Microgenomates group b